MVSLSLMAPGLQLTALRLLRTWEADNEQVRGIANIRNLLGPPVISISHGAKTIKLSMVIEAHNIPALDVFSGKCHITSQNPRLRGRCYNFTF